VNDFDPSSRCPRPRTSCVFEYISHSTVLPVKNTLADLRTKCYRKDIIRTAIYVIHGNRRINPASVAVASSKNTREVASVFLTELYKMINFDPLSTNCYDKYNFFKSTQYLYYMWWYTFFGQFNFFAF